MKNTCMPALFCAALVLSSCATTEPQEGTRRPRRPAVLLSRSCQLTPKDAATAEAETKKEAAATEEAAQTPEEAAAVQEAARLARNDARDVANYRPTAAQQEDARRMLMEGIGVIDLDLNYDDMPDNAPRVRLDSAEGLDGSDNMGVLDVNTAVPGGRGLRMGRYTPPEEAASSSPHAAPGPNTVERRGLRSPLLPKDLPMDVNGKPTPTAAH